MWSETLRSLKYILVVVGLSSVLAADSCDADDT